MGSRAFLLLGLLFTVVLVASEVSAKELIKTEQKIETNGRVGGYGGPNGHGDDGGGGGGGYGGRRCFNGCCGGSYMCRCCNSAAEAKAYAATQAHAKAQN